LILLCLRSNISGGIVKLMHGSVAVLWSAAHH